MRFLIAVVLSMQALLAHADVASSTDIQSPYARAALQVQRNSAVFMQLTNRGAQAVAIVSASSPAASDVELHTHINDAGVMRMRRIPRIELPPGQMVELKPGGLHVMLLGLGGDLEPGQQLALTLTFSDGSETRLQVPVKKVMPPAGMKHHRPMMKH